MMADDKAAIIEKLGLGPVDIVGHSDGADLALLLVRDHLPDYAKVSPDGADHWMTLLAKCYDMWLQPVVIEPADLKMISIPVLVMAGDRDFTSIEDNSEIFRDLPRGQLIIVPASNHGTFNQRPDLADLAIREFLDQADSDRTGH
jgi:pimeloyl-ACP methyl ester carboxylesterase